MKLLAQIINPAINPNIGAFGDQAAAAPKFAGFLAIILRLGLMLGAILSLIYLLWGGFEWIVSGGDKTNLENARNKIIQAVIGLGLIAAVIAIMNFIGSVLQINLLNLTVPTAGDIK